MKDANLSRKVIKIKYLPKGGKDTDENVKPLNKDDVEKLKILLDDAASQRSTEVIMYNFPFRK